MWGAYRSDELDKLSDYNDNTLDNISAVNLLPTNSYATWAISIRSSTTVTSY